MKGKGKGEINGDSIMLTHHFPHRMHTELSTVDSDSEGDAQRYFDSARTLLHTLRFLRKNPALKVGNEVCE